MCNLFNVLPYTIGNAACCRTFPNELISRCGDDVDGDGSLGSLHDLGRRHPGAPAAPCAVTAAAVVHARAGRRPRLYCLPCRYEEIDEQVSIAIDAPQARNYIMEVSEAMEANSPGFGFYHYLGDM